jgi:hypothetical protein
VFNHICSLSGTCDVSFWHRAVTWFGESYIVAGRLESSAAMSVSCHTGGGGGQWNMQIPVQNFAYATKLYTNTPTKNPQTMQVKCTKKLKKQKQGKSNGIVQRM